MKPTEHTSETNQKDIMINRIFPCAIGPVWEAWTQAERFKAWWGPKGYTCPHAHIDFRVGGTCVASMKNHDQEMWSTNTYKEIAENQKIVMTDAFADPHGNAISAAQAGMGGVWDKPCIITLEFDENYGQTEMVLKHEGIPVEMHDDCTKGWQESFDKLEALLKRSKG